MNRYLKTGLLVAIPFCLLLAVGLYACMKKTNHGEALGHSKSLIRAQEGRSSRTGLIHTSTSTSKPFEGGSESRVSVDTRLLSGELTTYKSREKGTKIQSSAVNQSAREEANVTISSRPRQRGTASVRRPSQHNNRPGVTKIAHTLAAQTSRGTAVSTVTPTVKTISTSKNTSDSSVKMSSEQTFLNRPGATTLTTSLSQTSGQEDTTVGSEMPTASSTIRDPYALPLGNSERVFLFAQYGSDVKAWEAANDWAMKELTRQESPFRNFNRWVLWSVNNDEGAAYGFTVDFCD